MNSRIPLSVSLEFHPAIAKKTTPCADCSKPIEKGESCARREMHISLLGVAESGHICRRCIDPEVIDLLNEGRPVRFKMG